MLLVKKEAAVPYWMHFVDWMWMTAMMIVWLVLIAVVGYAAVLSAWRYTERHRPPTSA